MKTFLSASREERKEISSLRGPTIPQERDGKEKIGLRRSV